MALASASASIPLHVKLQSCSLAPPTIRCSHVGGRQHFLSPSAPAKQKMDYLKLSSCHSICSSGLQPLLLQSRNCGILPPAISGSSSRPRFTVFAHKGYKMKTHKASAKRFRVSGRGKIMRRKSGKEHLLLKKSRTRKLRLSKMAEVSKRDYDNVVSCLPYMKVNRNAK